MHSNAIAGVIDYILSSPVLSYYRSPKNVLLPSTPKIPLPPPQKLIVAGYVPELQ